MHEPVAQPALVTFGEFTLDRDAGELRRGAVRVAIPDQPLRLLEVLLDRPGVVVSREQLRKRLWPADTFVDFEHGLNAAVKRLRDVLADSADAPRFIETVPKRGYRFLAPVGELPPPSGHTAAAASPRAFPLTQAGAVVALVALLTVAGLLTWNWPGAGETDGAYRKLSRLTFGPGLQTDVSWSPDGRFIAYASDRSGNFDIWVQPVTPGDPVQVTRSPAADWQPSWSPDGRVIAFRSERDGGGVYVVPALGGAEERIAPFGTRPTWAPDGSQVLVGAIEMAGNGTLQRLYVVKLDGRPPRQVRQDVIDRLEDVGSWRWHPDSRRVSVFASAGARDPRLFTVPLEGGPPVESIIRIGGPELQHAMDYQWAPGGGAIFINILLTSNTSEFWRVTLDPRTLQQVRSERLMASSGAAEKPAVSRQGDRLAFGMTSASGRLWSFPFDASSGRITGDGVPLTDTGALAGTSDLTREGNTLVYESTHPGTSRNELWVLDVEEGTRRSLTNDDHLRASVQWSRDGRKIAYLLLRAVGGAQRRYEGLVTVRTRDAAEEPLTSPLPTNRDTHDFIAPVDWSPDGQSVLASFDHPNRHFSIGLLPLAAAPHAEKSMTILASDPRYNLWQGNYSPNGKWIAFVVEHRQQPGRAEIAVMPGSGAHPDAWTFVTGSERWADNPRWSPDGRMLYFLQSPSRDGVLIFNVWGMPFDPVRGRPTGPAFQVTHFHGPSQMVSGELSVSATRLVLPMKEQTGSIWMLDGVDR